METERGDASLAALSAGTRSGRAAAPGRKRSEQSRRAVLVATRDLVASRGYENLSIEAIAKRAGVGKVTIYRWWKTKGLVVADAVLEGGLTDRLEPPADTGDVAADLREWIYAVIAYVNTPIGGSYFRALASATSESEVIGRLLYETLTAPAKATVTTRLQAAADAGQVRTDADFAAAADAILGALLYRVLTRAEHLSRAQADALLDLLMLGLRPR